MACGDLSNRLPVEAREDSAPEVPQWTRDGQTPNRAGAMERDVPAESDADVPPMKWVTGEPLRRLLRDFTGERTGYVQVGEQGWFLPSKYASEARHFLNFKPRPDDVWVVTYPRSGTTWTQEMVWLIANDLDYNTARNIPLNDRFPFFEFNLFMHESTTLELLSLNAGHPDRQQAILGMAEPGYQILERVKGRRFIKTHFPFSLLPKDLLTCGAKVIYVARNPKDVAVSFFHLNKLICTQGYQGDFPTYWNYFQNDMHVWTPYWTHVEEGWQRRAHPKLLFMFYEDMNRPLDSASTLKDLADTFTGVVMADFHINYSAVTDTPAAITKVSEFLGKSLTHDELKGLTEHLSISNFRKNPAVNSEGLYELGVMRRDEPGFVRNGKTGGWVEYFTPELTTQADEWIQNNLANTELRFPGSC